MKELGAAHVDETPPLGARVCPPDGHVPRPGESGEGVTNEGVDRLFFRVVARNLALEDDLTEGLSFQEERVWVEVCGGWHVSPR